MNYIDDIAAEMRRRVPDDVLPHGDTSMLFRMYAMLALSKGLDVTAADVHDAWSVWMLSLGQDHSALRPFSELREDVRQGDIPYVKAVHETVRSLGIVANSN